MSSDAVKLFSRSYKVFDGLLTRAGVPYCSSKDVGAALRSVAPWDTFVSGTPDGEDWVKVGEQYLPIYFEGVQVLHPLAQASDAESQHETKSEPSDLADAHRAYMRSFSKASGALSSLACVSRPQADAAVLAALDSILARHTSSSVSWAVDTILAECPPLLASSASPRTVVAQEPALPTVLPDVIEVQRVSPVVAPAARLGGPVTRASDARGWWKHFDGEWINYRQERCSIKDGKILQESDNPIVLTEDPHASNAIAAQFMQNGQRFFVHLDATGNLQWSDGDVWCRASSPDITVKSVREPDGRDGSRAGYAIGLDNEAALLRAARRNASQSTCDAASPGESCGY